jgi:hypothetical protein
MTLELAMSAAMKRARAEYRESGCRDGFVFTEGTWQGYVDTFFGDLALNGAAFQVGGFRAVFRHRPGGGTFIMVYNEATLGSAVGESFVRQVTGAGQIPALHRSRSEPSWADLVLGAATGVHPSNAMTNIYQRFYWTER